MYIPKLLYKMIPIRSALFESPSAILLRIVYLRLILFHFFLLSHFHFSLFVFVLVPFISTVVCLWYF